MAERPPRILLAGGGTGGHVYPAIAIADALRRRSPHAEIAFAGTRERMEWDAVPKAGYQIRPVTSSGFYRGEPRRNIKLPVMLLKGLVESRSLVREFRPDVAVGTGGYVSGPVLAAAHLSGRPIVIQEQNAYAGVTNRLLARWARKIFVAFEEVTRYLPQEKCVLTGNPTRQELRQANRSEARRFYGLPEEAFILAIFGGSLGSRAINEAMARSLNNILADPNTHLIWQTGKGYFEEMRQRVEPHERLHLLQYIDRMDLTYAAADVVLARSGAITCSELMVTGKPSILVPSPNVAEDHQTHNARSMMTAGAAVLLPETELAQRVADEIISLRQNEEHRAAMAAAAKTLARPDAADEIAQDVLAIAGRVEPQ